MNIYVTDRNSVPTYSQVAISHIISIGNKEICPDISKFGNHNLTYYRICFDDVSDSGHQNPPTYEIVERLIKIYISIPSNSHVLFHCSAGISRSTAAAFLYLVVKGISYEKAWEEVLRARYPGASNIPDDYIRPNNLMIYYADQIFGDNGEMIKWILEKKGDTKWNFK